MMEADNIEMAVGISVDPAYCCTSNCFSVRSLVVWYVLSANPDCNSLQF